MQRETSATNWSQIMASGTVPLWCQHPEQWGSICEGQCTTPGSTLWWLSDPSHSPQAPPLYVCLDIFPTSRPPPWSARNESSSRLLALFVCPPSAAECFCLCWSLHACTYVSYRCASVCAYWARVWPCSWLDLGAPSCGRLISLRLQGRQPLTQRNILPYRFEQKVTAV